jgi:hypothetical protein
MKYIKKYESNEEPQVGDYVICDKMKIFSNDPDVREFISNNIGKCVSIDSVTVQKNTWDYTIMFNVPKNLNHFFFYD